MRACSTYRWNVTAHLFAGALIAIAVTGCQAARRFGGLVQVETEPTADIPEIPPPAQRLASGKAVAEQRADNATAQRLVKPAQGTEAAAETKAVSARISSRDQGDSAVQPASASEPATETASIEINDKPAYAISDRSPEDKTVARPASLKRSVNSISDRTESEGKSELAAKEPVTKKRGRSTRDTERLLREPPKARTASERRPTSPTQSDAKEPRVASVSDIPSGAVDKTKPKNRTTTASDKNAIVNNDEADRVLDAFSSSSPEVQQQALRQLLTMAASNAKRSDQPSSIDELLKQAMASPVDLPEPRRTPSPVQTSRLGDRPDNTTDVDVDVTSVAVADEPKTAETTSDVVPVSASASRSDRSKVSRAIDVDDPSNEDSAVQNAVAQVSNALLSDEALFDMLIRRLKQPTEDETESARHRRQIMIRHLMVMSGRPEAVAEEMDGLTKGEQEFLRHQLLGLWTIIDPEGHPVPSRRFSAALPEIRAATKHLAASTDSLEVQSLAFCTQIEAYGQVKEFATAKFSPNQQVLLYCEVDNFAAKELSEGGFETHLQGSYAVYDDNNTKIVSQLLPADKQVSRNYLRDYYIAYQMPMPSELAAGNYRLELTMEDINGKKYGQSSIDFAIKP